MMSCAAGNSVQDASCGNSSMRQKVHFRMTVPVPHRLWAKSNLYARPFGHFHCLDRRWIKWWRAHLIKDFGGNVTPLG